MLVPRHPVPSLVVPVLDGGMFDLAADRPGRFSLIVFYRGLHCPICVRYLQELDRLVDEFAKRGVTTIAISSDHRERAVAMREKCGATKLRFGYDLGFDTARRFGLFLSTSRGPTSAGVDEPPVFPEPGLFLVQPDGRLYFSSVQSMPFARPHLDEIMQGVDFAIRTDYPARGEFLGELAT